VADVEVDDEYPFERRWYGSNPEQLQRLAEWLIEQQVEEAVMESTAQYWKPVWSALERYWKPNRQNREGAEKMSGTLLLAQALSNLGRRGRKKDFPDAERLLKRLVSQELTLSFVPMANTVYGGHLRAQRINERVTGYVYRVNWRRYWEKRISSCPVWSRIRWEPVRVACWHALAEGETDPAALAALGDKRLSATAAELSDALGACTELNPVYRRLVRLALHDLQLIEQQIGQLDQEIASLLREHQDAVQRLAEVPGLGVDSAQHIIAKVGAKAATFASAKYLVSWVGACPGEEESAGVNRSKRSPKGNRQMRRILNQAANAAVKHKGSIFEIVYRRLVLRLGHHKTIGAIGHRLCELIWIILHKGVRYEERGPSVCEKTKRARTSRMIRTLRALGYRVEPAVIPA
jgi:transposase